MSILHKESIADAKRLRELAEKNAKNAIIENITPVIKGLIEKSLLGESLDDAEESILMDLGLPSEQSSGAPMMAASGVVAGPVGVGLGQEEPAAVSLPDEQGKITLDIDQLDLTNDDAELQLTNEAVKTLAGMFDASSEQFSVRTMLVGDKLKTLKESKGTDSVSYVEKLRQLKTEVENVFFDLNESVKRGNVPDQIQSVIEENLESLYSNIMDSYYPLKLKLVKENCLSIVEKAERFNKIMENYQLSEKASKLFNDELVKTLKEALVINDTVNELKSNTQDSSLTSFSNSLQILCKEIFQMANKNGALTEAELRVLLKGLPDGVDTSGLEAEVVPSDAMGDAMGDDDDMDMGMSDDMSLDLGSGDEGVPEEEPGMDMGMDMDADDDLEEVDVAIDMGLPDDVELDAGDVSASVSPVDDEEGDVGMDMDDDEVVEISEADLANELKRLKSLKLNEEADCDVSSSPKKHSGQGPAHEEDFGGGKSVGEPFVDKVSEVGALSESEDDDEDDEDLDEAEEVEETVTESKSQLRAFVAKLKKEASLTKKSLLEAQKQLIEANLFNAKLVYANKLLQNENLTQKQRHTIINALDGAESVKEVKKMYATMQEAFTGKQKNKPLAESAKAVVEGRSSRQQLSGGASRALLTEADKQEYSRWGELAGVPFKND